MKTKSYFIIVLLYIVTLLFATGFAFAGNIGRAVYGIYSETYNGAGFYQDEAGSENIVLWSEDWGWGIDANYTEDSNCEGRKCCKIENKNTVIYFVFSQPQNMSIYQNGRLYFKLKYPNELSTTYASIKIQDVSGDREIRFDSTAIKRIDGGGGTAVTNDGNWHDYYVELSSFPGLDLMNKNIKCPLIVTNTLSNGTDFYLIDNVYWTKAPNATRSFNVTVKNISDNQVATDEIITWSQSAYRQSWTAAEQYIELDLDQESYDWFVKIYLDNGKASRNGLYCVDSDDSEIVLPMAWRMRPDLVSGGNFTLLIGANGDDGLYDKGLDPGGTDWYTWSPIKEIKDKTVEEYDYVTIWNLKGIHTVVKYHNAFDSLPNYEKKPKIYFAADCSNAIGGLEYEANIVTELVFE